MTDNTKLMKEFSSIYAASNRAKKSIVAELAKIDEKYRKLAEQEKAELNDALKMLESQLSFYGGLMGLGDKQEEETPKVEETVVETPAEPVEEKIQDTIFPENNENEQENLSEETKVEEPESEKKESDEFSDIWPEETTDSAPAQESDDDDWPDDIAAWK